MLTTLIRGVISAVILVTVSEVSDRYPKLGAFLLTLPLVSILAFIMTWFRHGDLGVISRLSRETLVFVPLTLPFFVPLAFARQLHLGFWSAIVVGIALSAAAIGGWVMWGSRWVGLD